MNTAATTAQRWGWSVNRWESPSNVAQPNREPAQDRAGDGRLGDRDKRDEGEDHRGEDACREGGGHYPAQTPAGYGDGRGHGVLQGWGVRDERVV